MTPEQIKTASKLLEHYHARRSEVANLEEAVIVGLVAVTLSFSNGERVTVHTSGDLSDTVQLRADLGEAITNRVKLSRSATHDHLTSMGVEI